MRQTTLSVTLEVKPESEGRLTALLDQLHDRRAPGSTPGSSDDDFGWFMAGVPSVHFLSMNAFPGADFDPLFVLEANFDGAPSVFWGQLEAAIGEDLRALLRCCKKPLTANGVLYEAVTRAGSSAPVAPYFEAMTSQPTVFHHGNRGMTRDRIIAERDLFIAIRKEIATAHGPGPSPYRGSTPEKIHRDLRAALAPGYAWLLERAPARVPFLTRCGDFARLIGFAILVIVALALPGLILASFMPNLRYLILLAAALAFSLYHLYRMSDALPGTDTGGKFNLITALFKPQTLLLLLVGGALYVLLAVLLTVTTSVLAGVSIEAARGHALRLALLGLICVPVTVLGIVAWLRYLERRDSSQDAPPVNEDMVRQMAQREDWVPQNHMGSIVVIKPGVLRAIIIRAGHHGLGLALRALANSGVRGYLGSMRTVHFAHWVFANNTSRLIFFSNFDQSWESYLDDFIEKAHVGLTLAWGCGIGFPPTRFLIQDGASHGRKFKAWARHSMTISRFWYSAYPDLTVDQVERNNRIANGLRKPVLTQKEASAWINDL
jgi:membrane protein implicated in regulation of membrane protease activity